MSCERILTVFSLVCAVYVIYCFHFVLFRCLTCIRYAAKYPDLENKPLSDTSGLTSTHQTAASKLALPTTPSQPTNSENFSSRVQMSTSTAKTRKERRQEVSGPVVFRKSSRSGAKAVTRTDTRTPWKLSMGWSLEVAEID